LGYKKKRSMDGQETEKLTLKRKKTSTQKVTLPYFKPISAGEGRWVFEEKKKEPTD